MPSGHYEAVQGLSDKDARAYLLDALDRRTSGYNERKCRVLSHLGLPEIATTPLALLISLHDRRGCVVSYDALCGVAEFEVDIHRAHSVSVTLLASQIKRLRKTIKAHGWPVSITAHYRIGYSMDVQDGWRIEPAP